MRGYYNYAARFGKLQEHMQFRERAQAMPNRPPDKTEQICPVQPRAGRPHPPEVRLYFASRRADGERRGIQPCRQEVVVHRGGATPLPLIILGSSCKFSNVPWDPWKTSRGLHPYYTATCITPPAKAKGYSRLSCSPGLLLNCARAHAHTRLPRFD